MTRWHSGRTPRLTPTQARIYLLLQAGPKSSLDLELALWGEEGPEWAHSTLMTHIVLMNRRLRRVGLMVRNSVTHPGRGDRRGVYRIVATRAADLPAHKEFDRDGLFVG